MTSYVSKFAIGSDTLEVKDAEARETANTAATNATNALSKATALEKLSRVTVSYASATETITITTGDHTK